MHHSKHYIFLHSQDLSLSFTPIDKLFHRYNTRASSQKRMEQLEYENQDLREDVTSLKSNLERLTTMMETLVAAQNQPSLETIQRTVISEVVSMPISVAPVNAPQY